MEVADELRGVDKLSVGFEQGEVVRPGDGTGDEAEDLPALLVKTKGPGCATEADRVQVGKQRVDSRCPGTCRAAHCVAHAHDTAADVPAGQRDVVTAHLAQSGSLSRGGVGRRGWNRRVAWQEPVDVTAQLPRSAGSRPLAALVRLPPASSSEPPSRAAGAGGPHALTATGCAPLWVQRPAIV